MPIKDLGREPESYFYQGQRKSLSNSRIYCSRICWNKSSSLAQRALLLLLKAEWLNCVCKVLLAIWEVWIPVQGKLGLGGTLNQLLVGNFALSIEYPVLTSVFKWRFDEWNKSWFGPLFSVTEPSCLFRSGSSQVATDGSVPGCNYKEYVCACVYVGMHVYIYICILSLYIIYIFVIILYVYYIIWKPLPQKILQSIVASNYCKPTSVLLRVSFFLSSWAICWSVRVIICFPDRCSSLQSSPLFKQVEQNGATKITLLLRRCLEERFQPQTNAVICPPSTYSKTKSSLKLPIWYWSETRGFFFFLFLSRSPAAQLIR